MLRRAAIFTLLLCFAVSLRTGASAADLSGIAAGTAPPDTPWARQWERFGAAAAVAGFEMELLVQGELGSEEAILSALRRNRVQVGGFTAAGLVSVVPETAVLLAPYVFKSVDQQDHVLDHTLGPALQPAFREAGLVLLHWIDSGWGAVFAVEPVRLPEDLAGMRIRISPNFAHQAVMKALGADAVPIGLGDFLPGLQSGLVQGGVSVAVFYDAVARDYAPFFTLTRHYRETGAMVANAEWYDQLPPAKQDALRSAFGRPQAVRQEVRDMEAELIVSMAGHGVTVLEPTGDHLTIWQEATAPARELILSRVGELNPAVVEALTLGMERSTTGDVK